MRLSLLARQALAEFLGSAGLVTVVIGSGIAASRLSPADAGLQLLENALVTGAGLVALILAFGPVSGGHFNPVVTLADRVFGGVSTRQVAAYLPAQLAGGVLGAIAANLMFDLPAVNVSTRVRSGGGLWLSEALATFGLVLLIFGLVRAGRAALAPFAVGAYITAAYFWSSSTSFANPMIDGARMLSDTFAGIAPSSVPMFVLMQLLGGAAGVATAALLYPQVTAVADAVVVPHDGTSAPQAGATGTDPPHRPRGHLERSAAMTPSNEPVRAQQTTRIIDDLAYAYDDRFTRAEVEAVYRDSYAQLAEHARVFTYLPVLAQRFTCQRLDARARTAGQRARRAPTVLFVCTQNAGRSQIAAALLRHYAGGAIHVHTAGSAPAADIHPEVAAAMAEIGLDLAEEFPKPLTADVLAAADVVVLVGCGDECPVLPGRRYEDWPVADPDGATPAQVAAIRADLDARVRELATSVLPDLVLPAPLTPPAPAAAR